MRCHLQILSSTVCSRWAILQTHHSLGIICSALWRTGPLLPPQRCYIRGLVYAEAPAPHGSFPSPALSAWVLWLLQLEDVCVTCAHIWPRATWWKRTVDEKGRAVLLLSLLLLLRLQLSKKHCTWTFPTATATKATVLPRKRVQRAPVWGDLW